MATLSKKIIIIICCFFLSLVFFLFFLKNQDPTIKKNKNYIFTPLITNDNLYRLNEIPDYPFVSTKVGSLRYFITNFLEIANQRQNIQNKLVFTYAGKRISELDKWGNNIPVLGKIYTTKQLTSWWLRQKPAWWQIFKLRNFNSWEASFARYVFLWRAEIEMISLIKPKYLANNVMTLKGYLRNHQQKITLIIYNLNKSPQEKKYLFNLANVIYSDLNQQLNSYIPEYSLYTIDYSLYSLQQNKEYGIYDLSLIIEDIPAYLKIDPSLKINNKIILGMLTNDNLFSFKNIVIDDKSKNLQLKFNSIHFPINENRWMKTYNKQERQYQYFLPIPRIPEELTYFLNFQYQFNQPVILKIIKNEKIEKNTTEQVIFSSDLLPISQETILSKPLTLPDIIYNDYQFLLISYQPLSQNEIESVRIDFLPFLEPEIVLEKTGDISNHFSAIRNNTGGIAVLTEHWPTQILTIFFSGLLILLLFFIFNWWSKINSKRFQRIIKPCSLLLKFLKQTRLIFIITIILLTFSAFSAIFNNEVLTEKLAIWFYIFLIISVCQSIIDYPSVYWHNR